MVSASVPDALAHLGPIARAADVPGLLAGLAQAATGLPGVDASAVSQHDPVRRTVRDVAMGGVRMNRVAEEYALSSYPLTAFVLDVGESVQIAAADPGGDPAERDELLHLGFARLLMGRVATEGCPVALVEVYGREDVPFPAETVSGLELLCSFAGEAHGRLELAARLEASYTATIEALVSALEARDPMTEAHAGRIRDLAGALAVALDLSPDERHGVRLGAILHDVGKIGISDTILLKPGPLTAGEWRIMRTHPELGERLLAGIPFLTAALPIVRHHHERWDGEGYPDGLRGEDIPAGARIVAVCDAWDAMTSDRPYRSARSPEHAAAELHGGAGTHFDPACVGLLLGLLEEIGSLEQLERQVVQFVE